jgi:hypothetical protein
MKFVPCLNYPNLKKKISSKNCLVLMFIKIQILSKYIKNPYVIGPHFGTVHN